MKAHGSLSMGKGAIISRKERKAKEDWLTKRRVVPEYIDDFSMSGKEIELVLDELEWMNKYTGGLGLSIYPVFQYLQNHRIHTPTIVDIGCGSGDAMAKVLRACKQAKQQVRLKGVDANIHVLEYARMRHFADEEVTLVFADVLKEPEKIPAADVYMINLFLHHLTFAQIQQLLDILVIKKPKMIVINDLERNRLAYFLFTVLSRIKRTSQVSLHDGQLSIKKGFNREDMKHIAGMLPGYEAVLKCHWAFRWQLVLTRKTREEQ